MPYLYLLSAIFLNPWIWKIWGENWIAALVLIFLTAFYLAYLFGFIRRVSLSFLITALVFSGLVLFVAGIDPRLKNPDPIQIWAINERRGLYPAPVGRLFQNKAVLTLDKITGNIYSSLDPNLYFFATHPRERVGISEFSKISPWFIPLFLVGLYFWLKSFRKIYLLPLVLSLLLSAVSDPASSVGPIAMFPMISSLIAFGMSKLI